MSLRRGLGLLACVTFIAACDVAPDLDQASVSSPSIATESGPASVPPPPAPAQPPPVTDGEGGSAYEAMCGHYCATLEKGMVYACLLNGGSAESCEPMWKGHADRCFELRCLSGRADVAVCLLQCDVLDRYYGPYCAVPDPGRQSLCPVPADEQTRSCRAGCSLSPEPPVESGVQAARS